MKAKEKARNPVTVTRTLDQYYREHVKPFKAAMKKAARTNPRAKKLYLKLQTFEKAFILRFYGK